MKKTFNRLTALLLCVLMVFALVPQLSLQVQAAPSAREFATAGDLPSYYISTGMTNVAGHTIYTYEEVIGSSGELEDVYRIYNATTMNVYDCNADGVATTGTALEAADIKAERPQPGYYKPEASYVNLVDAQLAGMNVLVEYNFVGRYRYNYAASANLYGGRSTNELEGFLYDPNPDVPVPEILDTTYGVGPTAVFNYGGGDLTFTQVASGTKKGNASKAELIPSEKADDSGETLDASNIKHAFLVMEASAEVQTDEVRQNVANRPMTLVGPTGGTMLSNGYLPEGFKVVYGDYPTLSGNEPALLYLHGTSPRNRMCTITDVTDFVREQGYGTYYGYNVPTLFKATMADAPCGWKLIIIEEDSTMENYRVGSLQLGMVNNSSAPLTLTVPFGGYTTPAEDDFAGQIFFSSAGSNPRATQCLLELYPDASSSNKVTVKTNDGANYNVSRSISSTSFGQNVITMNGQRRTDTSSFRMAAGAGSTFGDFSNLRTSDVRTDGMDVELLEVTNKKPNIGTDPHDAYLVNNSKSIKLDIPKSEGGDNYITAIGVMAEVDMPNFDSSITHHAKDNPENTEDIYVGNTIVITATAENTTKTTSQIPGLTNTQVRLDLDDRLTVDLSTLKVTFEDYENGSIGETYTDADFTQVYSLDDLKTQTSENLFYYDTETNTITINFGSDFEADDVSKTLHSNRDDKMVVTVEARTSETAQRNLTNTVTIIGEDAISLTDALVQLDSQTYATESDVFTTYLYPVIAKNAFINAAIVAENGTGVTPVSVQMGDTIKYVITLTNNQYVGYSGINLVDILPAGLEIISVTSAVGSETGVTNADGTTTLSWSDISIAGREDDDAPPVVRAFTIEARVATVGVVFDNAASYAMIYNNRDVNVESSTTYHEVKSGRLLLSKSVDNSARSDISSLSDTFTIKIKLTKGANLFSGTVDVVPGRADDGVEMPTLTNLTFVSGVATVSLKDGQSLYISLPSGWTYEVEEDPVPSDYVVAYNAVMDLAKVTGTLEAGKTAVVRVANTLLRLVNLTYNANLDGGTLTVGNVPADVGYVSGETATATTPTGEFKRRVSEDTFVFAGWNTRADGSGTDYPAGTEFTITEDTVLYARWVIETPWVVTYNANGGQSMGEYSITQRLEDSHSVRALADTNFTYSGYTFVGWNTQADGSGTPYAAGAMISYAGSDNVFLYARWERQEYSVVYNANNGETTPAIHSVTKYVGDAHTVLTHSDIAVSSFAKNGCVLIGWSTDSGATKATYFGYENIGADTAGGELITLYAVWANTYTATYNVNGGTGLVPTDSNNPYANNSSVIVMGNVGGIEKTDYVFAGWNTEADGSGLDYSAGQTFSITGDTVLYAKWVAQEPGKWNIIYNNNGGSGGTTARENNNTNHTVLAGTVSRLNSDFTGWNTQPDGSGTPYAANATLYYSSSVETVTLYAQWKVHTYDVKYNPNGGSGAVYTLTETVGTDHDVLANTNSNLQFTRSGYTLLGWNTDSNAMGTRYYALNDLPGGVNGETITLYAQWVPIVVNKYNVTFAAATNGVFTTPFDPLATQTVPHDGYVSGVPGITADAAWVFVGWKSDQTDGIYNDTAVMAYAVTADTTFTAIYEPSSSAVVIFDYNGGMVTGGATSSYISGQPGTAYNTGTGYSGVPVPGKPHHTLIGWTLNGLPNIPAAGTLFAAAGSITKYIAVWTPDTKYTVTYNANGSDGAVPVDSGSPYFESSVVTALANTLTAPANKSFGGWTYFDGTTTKTVLPGETFVMPKANVTLAAIWNNDSTYTLVYNGNGATGGDMGDETNFAGTPFNLAENGYEKTNYTFIGWNTDPLGNGTSYGDEQSFTMPNYNITLYAQWEVDADAQYTVTYAASNAMLDNNSEIVFTRNSPVNVPIVTADEGYTFQGQWTCNLGGVYTTSELSNYVVVNDVTFTAIIVHHTARTLNFNANGGTNAPPPLTVANGTTISLTGMAATPPAGKTFVGWADKAIGGNMLGRVIMDSNQIIYAQYVDTPPGGTFMVLFSAGLNGELSVLNDPLATQTVIPGDKLTEIPEIDADEGFVFIGWKVNNAGYVLVDEALYYIPVLSDVKRYTALYAPVGTPTYKLHFEQGIGSNAPGDIVLPEGTEIDATVFTAVPPAGYVFTGWKVKDETEADAFIITINADMTLTAQYAVMNPAGPFTVTFYAGANGTTTPDSYSENVVGERKVTGVPSSVPTGRILSSVGV